MQDLFPVSFVELIRSLKLGAGPQHAFGSHGEHRSHRVGSSLEFRDFQHYTPGNDLRHVDWNIYRRTGELFLRCYEFQQSLPVYILLDLSESMFFEKPSRARLAFQFAAAIASAAMSQQDSVSIFTYGNAPGPQIRALRGASRLPRVLDFLSQLTAMKHTQLAAGIRYLQSQSARPGIAVIISDFLDEQATDAVCESISALRHRRVVLRMSHSDELLPELDGDLELLDCETGHIRKLLLTPAIREMYQKNYNDFSFALSQKMMTQGTQYHVLYADRPVVDQIGKVFPQGNLVV